MQNLEILKNISKLQQSSAKNYFESKERFFLMNISEKIALNSKTVLDDGEILFLEKIFKKYLKFVG